MNGVHYIITYYSNTSVSYWRIMDDFVQSQFLIILQNQINKSYIKKKNCIIIKHWTNNIYFKGSRRHPALRYPVSSSRVNRNYNGLQYNENASQRTINTRLESRVIQPYTCTGGLLTQNHWIFYKAAAHATVITPLWFRRQYGREIPRMDKIRKAFCYKIHIPLVVTWSYRPIANIENPCIFRAVSPGAPLSSTNFCETNRLCKRRHGIQL